MPKNNVSVRYLNRDFASIQDQLINFAEAYYPNTFRDFSEGSVGLMYIDMASYVGDVLSFYTDVQFKETFIQFAEEEKNVVSLANQLGYRPNVADPATTKLKVFIVVPAIEKDQTDELETIQGNLVEKAKSVQPDFRFVPIIEQNMIVGSSSQADVQFRTVRDVNFEVDDPQSPLEVDILEKNPNTGKPTKYLLTKEVQAVAGTVETTTFEFGEPEPYPTKVIEDENVIEILNVTDSQDNSWEEVSYLAQDATYKEYRNIEGLDQEFTEYKKETPFLLNLERQPKRFVTRTRSDDKTYLQFGSGVSTDSGNVQNPLEIGNPGISDEKKAEIPIDPANFLSTDSYGEVPFETTLEVEYTSGGGTKSNVGIDDLTNIINVNFNLKNVDTGGIQENEQTVQDIQNSVRVTNPIPATGGGSGEDVEEIRRNAQAFFAAQNRAVTKEDYVTRVLSMPSKYGSVAKAMVRNADSSGFSINLYVLGWDEEKNLVSVNPAIKQNIRNFLKKYRMLTDGVTVTNGDVINLQIKAEISIAGSGSKRKAKISAINKLEELFMPENRNFDEPILKGEVISQVNSLDLVQNVRDISFQNKVDPDEGYSGNRYDIGYATRRGVIYPSEDPSVFTVRFPNKDIKVKVV